MSELEKLNVGVANIGEIFNLIDGDENTKFSPQKPNFENLRIPNYQRPYRWTTQNVNELIDDVSEAVNGGKSNYLIGNIILHKNKDGDKEYFDIVDGQQRLTTLALILKTYENEGENIKFLDQKVNPNSRNVLINNFNFIANKLETLDKEKITKFIKEKLFLTYYIINTIDEAFDIFDTQNSRGKELTEVELLKNHHFLYIKADEVIKQEIAKKYKYYQNNNVWWENYSVIEGALNELYIARCIHNQKSFNVGNCFGCGNKIFDEFIGIYDKGYERKNELKFNSNIIKGNEYFSYLFKYTQLYELLFEKSQISDRYYINRSMLVMLLCYVDKFGIDKNFNDFFNLIFIYLFAVLSYYSQIRYDCSWLVNSGEMTILKRLYFFIESSDFSSFLIQRVKNDIGDGFSFGENGTTNYIKNPNYAYGLLTQKAKNTFSKEYIEKISFKKIIFKGKK